MRPERSERKRSKHTRVLFKKSDLTVGRSSIFSDVSQRYAKSAISRMKRNVKHHEYYSDKGKLKRDLSLETDICILRRYCKWKLMSLGASSAKSKYTAYNGTDQDTIEEFADSSASGDNRPSDKSHIFNVDITVLMMENLRNLLNIWIKKHLMDDDEMKQKFNDVLDSILHKLDSNDKDSLCTTFVLERDSKCVNERPSISCSDVCQICRKKKLSSPVESQKIRNRHSFDNSSGKTTNHLRIISTLSIPRKLYETRSITKNETNQKHKSSKKRVEVKRLYDNEMIVAPHKSTMVSIRTKSSTKNCFVLAGNNNIKENNIHMLKIFPKLFYRSSSEIKKDDTSKGKSKNKKPFDVVPSLVRSMYIDDPANVTSTEANFVLESRKEEFTMTDFNKPQAKSRNPYINPLVTRNDKAIQKKKDSFGTVVEKKHINVDQSKTDECPCGIIRANLKDIKHQVNETRITSKSPSLPPTDFDETNIINQNPKPDAKKTTHQTSGYKMYSPRTRSVRCKRFPRYRVRRRVFKKSPEKVLEGRVRRIIRYFLEFNGSRNIKFDVNINVCPFMDDDAKTVVNDSGDKKIKDNVKNESVITTDCQSCADTVINTDCPCYVPPTVLIYTENVSDRYPAIIPLLDGAASHAKYMVDSKNSTTDDLLNNHNTDRDNVTFEDITELKTIVSNITHTTEKLVHEHMKRKVEKFRNNPSYTKVEAKLHVPSPSYTKVEANLRAAQKESYTKFKARIPAVSNRSYTKFEAKLPTLANQTKMNTKETTVSSRNLIKSDTKSQAVSVPSSFNVEAKEIQTIASSTSARAKISTLPDTNKPLQVETQSKGIQISIVSRSPETGVSGLKLIKEPRKTDTPRYKPVKKSASYAIIESESILRVTDMTVAEAIASEEKSPRQKSQSLMNLKTASEKSRIHINKPKIITFYCDECAKKYNYTHSSVTKVTKNPSDVSKADEDQVFSGNHAAHIIENYYELSNGVYPEARIDYESLKPYKYNEFTYKMDTQKHVTKRPKSGTRYPRKNSTFVVAFALHETYDDLATAQQMICNRKSPKDSSSANSITPVADTASKDSNATQFLNLDQNATESNTETNILVLDNSYHIDSDKYQKGDTKEDPVDQPQVIFSANYNKRPRNKNQNNNPKFTKRSNKYKGALDIRNTHFKYRNNRINTVNRLGKFYSKTRKNSVSDNLKLYNNSMTNVVSKTRILKKVSAKENLLDADSIFDVGEFEQSDMGSMKSSLSTVKQLSCTSQNTLIRNTSSNFPNNKNNLVDDQDDLSRKNSVVQICADNSFPCKTDVLNVSVAVTYKPNDNENKKTDEEISNAHLTSSAPTEQSSGSLESNSGSSTSKNSNKKSLDQFEYSDSTLTGSEHQYATDVSIDSDTYVIEEPQSVSKAVYIPDLASQNTVPNIQPNATYHKYPIPDVKTINNKQALLDTVINLGIFSDLNTSSGTENNNRINDLIKGTRNITVETNILDNKGDYQTEKKKMPIGVFQKSFTTLEKTVNVQRNINLPSEDVIKNILKDRENLQTKSCSEGVNVYPTTVSELWERIVVILDLTVKRLEDTLAEKIVKELTKSSPIFQKLARPIPEIQPIEEAVSTMPEKQLVTANESVQCDLVKKQMIDNIMLKLSIQNTKPIFTPSTSKIPLKVKKPKLINDFVEVLKAPAEVTDIEKGDTVTISTEYAPMEETSEYERLDRFKSILYIPVAFIRENLVVIASVTNFCVLLLCIYGFFVIIMKP